MRLPLLTIVGLCSLLLPITALPSPPSAHIRDGSRVIGIHVEPDAEAFLGIPFAAPPVGRLRFFRPERPPKQPLALINATAYAPRCVQFRPMAMDKGGVGEDEDCLYLNIFRPRGTSQDDRLPVLVFIHGGSFESGSAARYPPSNIAEAIVSRGIIFVNIQYRLNIFGFPQGPGFYWKNLGLLDQHEALKWLHSNILAFGGAPWRVTLMGHSAGSAAVSMRLQDNHVGYEELFSQAILMSGSQEAPWALADSPYTKSINATAVVGAAAGCPLDDDLASCLQELSWDELKAIAEKSVPRGQSCCTWAPVRGGGIVKEKGAALKLSKDFPVLMGNTQEEFFDILVDLVDGGMMKREAFTRATFDGYVGQVSKGNQAFAGLLIGIYSPQPLPSDDDHDAWIHAISKLMTGMAFVAGTAKEALKLAAVTPNIYLYSFDYASSSSGFPWPMGVQAAFHSWDLQLLFGLSKYPLTKRDFDYTDADRQISETIAELFTSFVKTGKPSSPNVPSWEPVGHYSRYLSIGLSSSMQNGYAANLAQLLSAM